MSRLGHAATRSDLQAAFGSQALPTSAFKEHQGLWNYLGKLHGKHGYQASIRVTPPSSYPNGTVCVTVIADMKRPHGRYEAESGGLNAALIALHKNNSFSIEFYGSSKGSERNLDEQDALGNLTNWVSDLSTMYSARGLEESVHANPSWSQGYVAIDLRGRKSPPERRYDH